MRILIADGNHSLAAEWMQRLRSMGAVVDHVSTGAQADAALISNEGFDVLLLDLDLSELNGLRVLENLRERGSRLPVLVVASNDSIAQRVKCLDAGADDYMSKPVHIDELQARVRALARRSSGGGLLVHHGPLVYDQRGRVASIDGQKLNLSAREIGVLHVLLQQAGRLVSKEQLVERLCEWGEEVSFNAIEVYVHRLRKKIEQGSVRISTVRGLGYCLEKIPT